MIQSAHENIFELTRRRSDGFQMSTVPFTVEGVVLAGVHAWGDCPLDDIACRPLLPLAGRPLIWYALDWLHRYGVGTACICANSDSRTLRHHFRSGYAPDVSLHYFDDVMPRGPAGCVLDAVSDRSAELFVVVHGTTVPRFDLNAMLQFHQESQAVLTAAAVGGASREPADLRPAGVYVFSPRALRYVRSAGYEDIKENLIPRLHADGLRVASYRVDQRSVHAAMDLPSYRRLDAWAVTEAIQEPSRRGYEKRDEALVHKSAKLHPTVRLIGPVLVEPGAVIERDVVLVGATSIGSGCHVDKGAVVARSAVWTECRIGKGVVLDRCVLPSGSWVKDGFVAENTVVVTRPWRFGRLAPVLPRFRRPIREIRRKPSASGCAHGISGRALASGMAERGLMSTSDALPCFPSGSSSPAEASEGGMEI